jgi:hypothetical protein
MQVESALLFETPEEMAERVFCEIRPRTAPPRVKVEFRRFANVNSSIRLREGELILKVSDLLQSAPAPILEALFHILMRKLFRREVPAEYQQRYRRYLHQAEANGEVRQLRVARGWKLCEGPKGDCYDLEPLFHQLNQQFFEGSLPKPALGWSRQHSRTLLGHYDPSHHTIVLSKLLDSPAAPPLAVEFVLYHEMLHIRFPVQHNGSRRSVHTKEFRRAERAFPQFAAAKSAIKTLCANARRLSP